MSRTSSIPPTTLTQTRKRSSTVSSYSSILRHSPVVAPPPPPLALGESTTLTAWVDTQRDAVPVLLNAEFWPGIREGDLIHVTQHDDTSLEKNGEHNGFLFVYDPHLHPEKHAVQVQFNSTVANLFGFQKQVRLTKVDHEQHAADYVEVCFQDQYLGRSDMWRTSNHLAGQCVHVDQKINYAGCTDASVKAIYIGQKKVSAAFVAPRTKVIFRSLSAKITVFIQVCRELWHFSDDGERYYEKLVHSFLPALFEQWRALNTNHLVTIVLVSRVYYAQSELQLAAGPLRKDDDGNDYKDFFRVIVDHEVVPDHNWKETLVQLKESLWTFQRDILLTHHYHRAKAMAEAQSHSPPSAGQRKASEDSIASSGPDRAGIQAFKSGEVPILGRISFAHEGPILEAINLALNPTERHYIDRSLNITGATAILITPGTGHFSVSKHLLRLTTSRMLDQGFGLDLVCLGKPPLHRSPVFSFRAQDPELRQDGKTSSRSHDPLWGGDLHEDESTREKSLFYWEPFWVSTTFWDVQMDLPIRPDRFVARCRMHEIQMMSLLEHDLLSAIEIPFLETTVPQPSRLGQRGFDKKAAYDQFDADVFSFERRPSLGVQRASVTSSGGSTVMSSSVKTIRERSKRMSVLSQSASDRPSRNASPLDTPLSSSPTEKWSRAVPTITETSESPQPKRDEPTSNIRRQDSPSPSGSAHSHTQATPARPATHSTQSFASKLASSIFGALRPSAQASTSNTSSPVKESAPIELARPASPPKPVAIKGGPIRRTVPVSRQFSEEDTLQPHARHQPSRSSPGATPPRDSLGSGSLGLVRRSTLLSSRQPPSLHMNPSKPETRVPDSQTSLAKRWQHIFPRPSFEHTIKWKSMAAPACLPLTVDCAPTPTELDTEFNLNEYTFVVNTDMPSFLVRELPTQLRDDDRRSACALAVLRCMASLRLAQGFQFVLNPPAEPGHRADSWQFRGQQTHRGFKGVSEILRDPHTPVYLSMSNEIHCLSYNGEGIQVKRYRRLTNSPSFEYQCLVWPRMGDGYTSVATTFAFPNLEAYGWNRLDMLIAGYEQTFSDSLRYWRTRFIVLPSDPPMPDEGLNDEEIRLKGADKLAELFSKARWTSDSKPPPTALRFVATTLGPAACVLDANVTDRIDEVHATGPLQKKAKSERVFEQYSLAQIAKAMREPDGVPFKNYRWHSSTYHDAFTGSDFVSWLVREFKDVSTRDQATERGVRLQRQGLFEHCRHRHPFLDGNYFYQLVGEYATPPQRAWFHGRRQVSVEAQGDKASGLEVARPNKPPPINMHAKRQLLLSQTCIIDVDPNKKSDQAERVILHHDVIHNPVNGFHFELQWLGTTAKCIQDTLRSWNRAIEKSGLKIVEAHVDQIIDIGKKNVFQSCLPIRLARPPPVLSMKSFNDGTRTDNYFESMILRKFDFVLDVEAGSSYSDRVDVVYSYRAAPFKYAQYVHKSGAAFVQIIGGQEGFRWLKNRLIQPERGSLSQTKEKETPSDIVEGVRKRLEEFCADELALARFYDEALKNLPLTPTTAGSKDDVYSPVSHP